MCRWAAYIGQPIFLDDIIARPGHSLIVQSSNVSECKTTTNGDGFGLAWYDRRPEPGLYRDIYPAWSDPNLRSVAAQVCSGLFLAHVRASTGSATSRNNCHPFAVGRWSFMHNGQIGGFDQFRKHADMLIPDELYGFRKGATDSEALFLLALAEGLDADPVGALARAAGQMQAMSRQRGTGPHLRLSAAFSNGERLFAVRSSSDEISPSLYYRFCEKRKGWTVVSEPLETDEEGWNPMIPDRIAIFTRETVEEVDFAPLDPSDVEMAAE